MPQDATQTGIHCFKLGAFDIVTILDGALERPPHPTFGEDQPADKVADLARENGLSATAYDHVYVPTLVDTGRERVLFDTGNGQGRDPKVGKLMERLAAAGYRPEQIDVVVITHCHPDHINGLVAGGKPAYPNARYVFGQVEFDFWKRGENVREARKATRQAFMKNALPFADKATFVATEYEVVGGIRAIPTFGHSPGLMSYHVESDGQCLLIWADVANHFVFSVQRPAWHVAPDDDKELAATTRRRVFDWVATDRLPVVGFHMPFPSHGLVERAGTTYRWVPASP